MILALLQARVSSSRLPGKVLLPLAGRPMLEQEIERVRRAGRIEKIVVATSVDPSDDKIADLCNAIDIECYRGSLDDVLDRFYRAAVHFQASTIVRLTGDCPLIDPSVIDLTIDAFQTAGADYASNALVPSFPDGLDVEVFRMDVLEAAWREAKLRSDREHVTPFVWGRPDRFRTINVRQDVDRSTMRWTVDTPADFEFVRSIYDQLFASNPQFTTEDILALLNKDPQLGVINANQRRNDGYDKSLALDSIQADRD